MIELKGKIDPVKELQGKINAVPGGVYGSSDSMTYILVTEDGQEIPAVVVEEETVFTATANDIRKGTVAATAEGVTEGTKVIPTYHTTEGIEFIPAGSRIVINMYSDKCQFTKLQAIACSYNTNLANSVAAFAVSIEGNVYMTNSATAVSEVAVDAENQSIDFGVSNESTTPIVVRYFTYKEIE